MKKKIISLVGIVALSFGLLTGCGNQTTDNTTQTKDVTTTVNTKEEQKSSETSTEKEKLTIRISNFSGTVVPYHIAVDYGFIEEAFADTPYDVSIEITNFANGAAAVEAAQAGELDILTSGDQMITTAILENGLPFKLIGTSYTNKKYAFVARKDSGIETPKDLKGTKVGVKIGTNLYLGVLAFLEDNGYTADDVEIVNLSTADAYTAFLGGDIDWAILYGKQREDLIKDAGGILLGYNGDYKYNECVFGVSDSFGQKYPDVVATLVKVFDEATQYANANPDIIRENMKKNYDSDDETIGYILAGDTEYIVDITDEIKESIQRTLHYAYTQGINSREADADEVIDYSYLEAAGVHK